MLGKMLFAPINLRPVNCQVIGQLCPPVCSRIQDMFWIISCVVTMQKPMDAVLGCTSDTNTIG